MWARTTKLCTINQNLNGWVSWWQVCYQIGHTPSSLLYVQMLREIYNGVQNCFIDPELRILAQCWRSWRNILNFSSMPIFEVWVKGFPFFERSQTFKLTSSLDTLSWNFSGPRFWILTEGVISRPVWGLPCPKSIKCWERSNLLSSLFTS